MPHRYSSERRINKAKTKKRKSRKQKKVRNSRKMRKSRKNKYYSQNQEGGLPWPWPWTRKRKNIVAPDPDPDPNTMPLRQLLFYTPPVPRFGAVTSPTSYSQIGNYMPNTTPTEEEIEKRSKEKRKQDIINTIELIMFHRKTIRPLLLTEDNHFKKQLQADKLYDFYQNYTGNDYPQIDFDIKKKHNGKELTPQEHLDLLKKEFYMDYTINKEYNGDIINDQKYLELLDTELQTTLQYRISLQNFAKEYRRRQVYDKSYIEPYIEPYSSYREEISRHKADITSIRREIKQLLLHNKQQIKGTNLSFFQQYMVNYAGDAGELPRTVPQDIFYKEFELSELREELIRTQKDLQELETLIESPIQPPPPK
jgi:hypothetical protein